MPITTTRMITNFIIGFPHNPEFDPEAGEWQQLQEPTFIAAYAFGSALSLLLGGLFYYIAAIELDFSLDKFFDEFDLWFMLVFIVLIALHERLHALLHPGWGISSHTQYGFVPDGLIFYAHYDASVTRNRCVAILVAPFIGLTIMPLLIATFWPPIASMAGFIAVLNAAFSALDLFNAGLVWRRIPSDAEISNQGWNSYWRLPRVCQEE